MNENFGYMIVRYDKVKCFGESFRNWIKIVANALEFLRMKNDINYLMMCQNLSEFRDSETGLNNKIGFTNEFNIALRNKGDKTLNLYFLKLKLNKKNIVLGISTILEKISETYGEMCGRISDDIFVSSYKSEIIFEKINNILYGFFKENNIYGDELYSCFNFSEINTFDDFSVFLQNACADIEEKLKNTDENYRKLRSSIYLNPEKNITADDACRKFCISRGYFCVMYKKYFEISFHKDCVLLKTKLAKYLLVSTKMNISTVSEKCGFENEKYFMQQFKKNTGYTPNQYREKYCIFS